MPIRVLDPSVSALIAAGEVVERPASVVKELVENAVDAGATLIRVEIENGGRTRICISDNGCGMSAEEAVLAFRKHATSKICTKDDLFRIGTLGFRGEALPSIAAVSHVTLLTKRAEDLVGHRVRIDGTGIPQEEEFPSADGTVVTVEDLFYNTPARQKFLKSDLAETGAISEYVQRLSVSRPDVSFRLKVNGAETLFTPGSGKLLDTLYAVYGKAFAENLLPVDRTLDGIHVYGYVCKPIFSKPNRREQLFYVNGRTVRSKLLQTVLENAYRNCLMVSRFPYCVLFLETDLSAVDINVHPNKLDVKFSDEKSVAQALSAAIAAALSFDSGISEIRLSESEKPTPIVPVQNVEPPAQQPKTETVRHGEWTIETPVTEREMPVHMEKAPVANRTCFLSETPEPTLRDSVCKTPEEISVFFSAAVSPVTSAPQPEEPQDPLLMPEAGEPDAEDFRIIGEAFSAYILIQKENEILFVDKHALHERMNFERLKTEPISTQTLLAPYLFSIGSEEEALLLENRESRSQAGFDVDDFGGSLAVREIPSLLPASRIESALTDFCRQLISGNASINPLDEILHTVACKSAIKSGSETSELEERALIARYFREKDRLKYCPHGRPIAFALSRTAIEKEFKRIV